MITENLARIRAEMDDCCRTAGRDPAAVHLVAVTKTQEPTVLATLAAGGQLVYGENRSDHLALMHAAAPTGAAFHFIGTLQSRQFKHIVPLVSCIHSLYKPEHVAKLERACAAAGRDLDVFCQVNTAGEAQKGGCSPVDLPALLEAVTACDHLRPIGLMCMAPDLGLDSTDTDAVRRCFDDCRILAERQGLQRLSMGMSGDWQLAIAAGATDVRIGSALFR